MPLLRPMTHSNSYTAAYYSQAPLPGQPFWINFDMGEPQGMWVRETDGSFTQSNMTFDEALNAGYAEGDIFQVGHDGYYLTMADARQAIDTDSVHGVHYVDDYNNEFQDFFVCKADGLDPEPFVEAHKAEPIQ